MTDKRFFEIAAGWNLVAATGVMIQPGLFYKLAYGYEGPIDGVWLQLHIGFWFLIGLFGVGYGLVGRDPVHHRGTLVLGVIGKTGFALFWIAQVALWRGTLLLLPGALGDLVFAGLFVRWLRRHPA
jgi:hypothetical protein